MTTKFKTFDQWWERYSKNIESLEESKKMAIKGWAFQAYMEFSSEFKTLEQNLSTATEVINRAVEMLELAHGGMKTGMKKERYMELVKQALEKIKGEK